MVPANSDLSEALRILTQYCEERGIELVLIGALVPAVLLSGHKGSLQVGNRETRDADSVVNLASWQQWDTLITDLLQLGFRRGRDEEEQRLYFSTAQIDLIPFGAMVGPDEILTWPASGNRMNMIGVREAFAHSLPTEIVPGISIPVPPLWLFVVLKIAAYKDRGFPRDLTDLIHTLDEYEKFTPNSRRYDVLDQDGEVSFESSGAYLLGWDIKAQASAKALNLTRGFTQEIDGEYHQVINTILGEENRQFSESRRVYAYKLIRAFRLGLE